MKILIVKLGAFGDVIHTLPALDDLLIRPNMDIHWLIDARYAFLTELLLEKGVKAVHQTTLKGDAPLRGFVSAIKEMRALKFDAVLDLQGLIKSGLLARAISSHCFGFDANLSPEYGNHWLIKPVAFHAEERHVVQQYRRIAQAPFMANIVSTPEQPMQYAAPVFIPKDDAANSNNKLQLIPKNYVLMHVGGGWQTKMLPNTTWCKTAKGIHALGFTPVFIWGSEKEQQHAKQLAAESDALALVLPHRLGLQDLCSALSHAHAVIAADTGLLHLAAALGSATTISFWGPSASWRSAPFGKKHFHIESEPECGPCFKRQCSHFICMDNIIANQLLHNLK
ncbi:MAG: glycosyltransferase family 9 protein [Mariprofundaceae bacterium]